MLDSIAWLMSQPGVAHDSSVARTVAYMATNGANGIGGVDDLKVVANSTPNGTVQVRPGVAVIPSNYSGANSESYVARNITQTSVDVPATGSSAGQTYYLVIRIDDTGEAGQAPSDVQNYDYVKFELVARSSSSLKKVKELNLPYPAVLLAKITLPASTGTVTNSHITDLRQVANPRERTFLLSDEQIIPDGEQRLTSQIAYPHGQWWPAVGGTDNTAVYRVDAPEWATHVQIRYEALSVAMEDFSGNGYIWVVMDDKVQNEPAYWTGAFKWTSTDTPGRQNLVVADTLHIPKAWRGKSLVFGPRGNRLATGGKVWTDNQSGQSLQLRFIEQAD